MRQFACMKKLHAKSPCCRGEVHRFGNRRRQCSLCKKTWRIRQKKRGRKRKREQKTLLIRYLQHEIPSLHALARKKGIDAGKLEARLLRSRDYFLKHTPWPQAPEKGELILIADAMVKCVNKVWYTFYFILVRTTESNEAVVLKPFIRKGSESQLGWREVFNSLPDDIKKRVVALVCDGHRGLVNYARRQEWILQRCNFHLIAFLQGRRSRWARSRHREEGQRVYKLANHILTARDESKIMPSILKLEEIAQHTKSKELSKALRGFINNYKDFRSYLRHSELNLPRTSNTAESLIGCVRELCHRARGFRSMSSLRKWIFALIKNKKKIKCNGSFQPN